jgi:hypothetical protein
MRLSEMLLAEEVVVPEVTGTLTSLRRAHKAIRKKTGGCRPASRAS